MSTVAALSTDLSSLISESRRRNSEIKHAAESSLNILKSYDPSKQKEQDFLHYLTQEPNFITPFILSCQSRNAKFSSIAIHCLHRLISAHGLPIGSLENILDSLIEASHLPLEIQLKVLQLLPTIYQTFGDQMNDTLVSKLLFICAVLQGPSKPQVVVNTAAATLQQLIIFIFDKVSNEDKLDDSHVIKSHPVKVDNDEKILVSDNVYDCYRIFDDLCSLIEHHKPCFLQFSYLTETFLLELIESILNNFTSVFIKHTEMGYLLRFRITPIFLRSLSIPTKEFSVVVRIARIVYLLIRKNLQILNIECEIVISLLNHMILNDLESPIWKKIIVLEIFNGIFQDFNLVEAIFKEYDYNQDRKHVLNDFLINSYCLINSAGSKKIMKFRSVLHPPVSNINRAQSSTATATGSGSSLPNQPSPMVAEFLIDGSPDKITFMDMLDKTNPPDIPDNYVYYLVLSCFNNLVEGIGKYVMNLSISEADKSTTRKLVKFLDNPDIIESDTLKSEVIFSKSLIEKNYKVLLSTFEVFLYSKLSNECFHNLIRSLQKLCYSSGILGLNQPRDDIIMLFSISTINNTDEFYSDQVQNNSGQVGDQNTRSASDFSAAAVEEKPGAKDSKSFGESLFSSLSSKFTTHATNINQNLSSLATTISNVTSNPSSPLFGAHGSNNNGQLVLHSRYINSRHLITLRALINLGISLGSSLGMNWKNIFITLQWVNYYINGPPEDFEKKFVYYNSKYGTMPVIKQNEIAVIQSSIKKLFDSSKDYSVSSFLVVLVNLVELSNISIDSDKSKDKERQLFDKIITSVFDSCDNNNGEKPDDKVKNSFLPIANINLSPCYYNKQYFMDLLQTLCELNSSRFLVECMETSDSALAFNNEEVFVEGEASMTSLKFVFNYLIGLSINRGLSSQFRIKSVTIFNSILKSISKEEFSNSGKEEHITNDGNAVEFKLLTFMFYLFQNIDQFQKHDDELFSQQQKRGDDENNNSLITIVAAPVLNCEFEIISRSLENLKDLLDMFGVGFHRSSWSLVFKIIDLSFEFFEYGDPSNLQKLSEVNASYGLMEKKSELTKLSFEILQLILGDFLTVLPLNIIKILINSIHRFANQGFDINISFSAISHFWQVSDYIRELLTTEIPEGSYEKGNEILIGTVNSEDDLINYVQNEINDDNDIPEKDSSEQKFVAYSCLWIYLLKVLVDISNNQKDQVRNGSIQTFFRILDSHGKHLSSWHLCYSIVISSLFTIRPKILRTANWEELSTIKQEWSETLILIMSGIVKFYDNYFADFDHLEIGVALEYWTGLIKYFEDILSLNWNNCDLKLYQSFNDLLAPFVGKQDDKTTAIPTEIIDLLFNFWSGRNVSYNITLNKHYQDSLTSLMRSFVPLSEILGTRMDGLKIKKSLNLLNSAVKYPILPTYFNDNVYPTDLQKSVLDNLKLITDNDDPEVQSDVILQLISNIVLPFSTRSQIKEQLSKNRLPKDTKVCSFVSLSYYSVIILESQVKRINDFKPLLQNQSMIILISSLLEPIKQNAKGILAGSKKKSLAASSSLKIDLSSAKELWVECIKIILFVVHQITGILAKDDAVDEINVDTKKTFWQLIVELYKTTLMVSSNNGDYEEFNVTTLQDLRSQIVPYISLRCFPEQLVDNFANYILDCSYVYEKDEIELSLLEETGGGGGGMAKKPEKDLDQIVENFVNFDFDNDIPLVKPLKYVERYKINLICLNDLIELCKIPEKQADDNEAEDEGKTIVWESQTLISQKVLPCLIIRTLYVLRKFISHGSLINQVPLSKIEKLEMIIVLKGLNDLIFNFNDATPQEKSKKYQQLSVILPLVIKMIPLCGKVRGISGLVESFFYDYNENSKKMMRISRR
ncbi:Mon2 protein [Saccharomycopsis crataegensis]|uniref:Mon2 protein n=1 Tax=Saccharomycopsis crataegensis TaxID=43959 RepID=A0AAV5QMB6_9ASCO|nr:Mon2 protein [Saccharomycopsis crataegensis]